jgi:hypothetical protein
VKATNDELGAFRAPALPPGQVADVKGWLSVGAIQERVRKRVYLLVT